ncbi:helix-turn-helix domain-containing protein [Paenibacillus ehimensis]|uniref:helix-turn-helix domain-containing protein n=1 Tax=Paenibacillus ehimensis TaxID=79264 RepID=UPI0034E27786
MRLTPEIIRICRKALGWTQGKLARLANVSCPLLGSIEREERALLPHTESRIRKALPLTDEEISDLVRVNRTILTKKED